MIIDPVIFLLKIVGNRDILMKKMNFLDSKKMKEMRNYAFSCLKKTPKLIEQKIYFLTQRDQLKTKFQDIFTGSDRHEEYFKNYWQQCWEISSS